MGAPPYGPEAKAVLLSAFSAQRDWNHRHLHPEHLLWGVLETEPDLFGRPSTLAGDLKRWLAEGTGLTSGHQKGKYNWSDAAKTVLARARDDAASRGAKAIEPEHVLGALASSDSEFADMLRRYGVRPTNGSPDDAEVDVHLPIHLDDDSSDPYYLQIANQTKRAIAEGRLIPGENLRTVRELADSLQIAPGTVARAYRILQEEGVIVTNRSRGTTVAVPQFEMGSSDEQARLEALVGLLTPTAVAAYHMGSDLNELLRATRLAAEGVLE